MGVFVVKGDLCTYMLQESRVQEDAACRRKQAAFTLPATTSPLGQAVPVINVHRSHDGTVVTVGEDGVICCWSSELKLQKTKDAFVGFSKSKAETGRKIQMLFFWMSCRNCYSEFISLVCSICSVFLNYWIPLGVSAGWRAIEQEVKVGE